jgi:hypothetical protein
MEIGEHQVDGCATQRHERFFRATSGLDLRDIADRVERNLAIEAGVVDY